MSEINANTLTCNICGYDLSGTAVGGTCPECGTPVSASMAGVEGTSANKEASNAEIVCLIMGILSLFACAPICGPLGLYSYSNYQKLIGKRSNPSSMARTGQVLSIVGIVLFVAQCFLAAAIFASSSRW
jgi:hypothetical protein